MIILSQIVIGFLLLFLGGESVVRSAVKISQRFNVSKSLLGLTVVAYATSAPEMFISILSVFDGHHQIALGNVIGSNIANTFLIFGLCAILFPISITKKAVNFDMRFLILANVALIIFGSLGLISRLEGFILFLLLIIYTYVTFKLSFKAKSIRSDFAADIENSLKFKIGTITSFALLIIGIVFLIIGSKSLIMGCVQLALNFNIPQSVIAVTIVAIGGSAPEISTTLIAAYRQHSDLAVSNLVGSNIFNILGVIGVTSMLKPISTLATTLAIFDIWYMLFSAIILFAIGYFFKKISRVTGTIFLILYLLYLAWELSLII
jgi:cation:H+ antiporter